MKTFQSQSDQAIDAETGTICDLHCHSSYAGGTGSLDLRTAVENMPYKGVTIVGTGDCLYPPWLKTLKKKLHDPQQNGLLELKKPKKPVDLETKFVLQTELAFTGPIDVYRKNTHCVFLWPDFEAVDEAITVLEHYKVKNSMGRPFITSDSVEETAEKIHALLDIDPSVEFFPAHILVPLGIYGPKPSITYMRDFFGDAAERIHAFETGLSADPLITALIPELDELTLLSNSDAHSAAYNRLGRELTCFELEELSYDQLIAAIRNDKVAYTAEFHPSEGRYFLTGHRGGIRDHKEHQYCVFSPDMVPKSMVCPICGSTMEPGVLQRALELSIAQGSEREFGQQYGKKRKFYHMIPLIEIVANALGIKSARAKTVRREYLKIVTAIKNECKLWTMESAYLEKILEGLVDEELKTKILEVRKGNFCFDPPGFDGSYGELKIGTKARYQGIRKIEGIPHPKIQQTLDEFQ
ncbi:MAG: endonuclease Q family protein [Asgard group archaeon]|nr:endonuclease Q family protein [Asgard group archaeon]